MEPTFFVVLVVLLFIGLFLKGVNVVDQKMDRYHVGAQEGKDFIQRVPPINRNIGGLRSTRAHANSTTETTIWRSERIDNGYLGTGFNFWARISGLLSSNGSEDISLVLYWVNAAGTATALATLLTVSIPNEDEKPFNLDFNGRVTLEQAGATAAKVYCQGWLEAFFTTPYRLAAASVLAGVDVAMSTPGYFELRGDWDIAHADAQIDVISAICHVCNLPGGEGQ